MIEDIRRIIDTHTYVVDRWLLDKLDEEAKKPAYSSRANVDALAFEFTAERAGKIKKGPIVDGEKYQWRHDWMYDENTFIDLKRKPNNRPNVCLSNIDKMIKSYEMNQLTHIVAFSQNIEHDYKEGQKLYFKFEGVLPLREAIKRSAIRESYRLLNTNILRKS